MGSTIQRGPFRSLPQPSDAWTDDAVAAVRAHLEDRRCTILDLHREIAVRFLIDCSRTTIFQILTEVLDMRKVAARWVPHLSGEDKKRRMGAALEFLLEYNEVGDEILDRIVTGDKSWVHFWTPESKEKSKLWKKKEESARENANRSPA